MSHSHQQNFVQWVKLLYPESFENTTVLEVGSLDINGNLNWAFTNCDHLKIDLHAGENVTLVCHVTELENTDESFDTVVGCEFAEHDQFWRKSFEKMYELLKPNGLLLITAAGDFRPEHGTSAHNPEDSPATNDYYCNISNEMFESVLPPSLFTTYFVRQLSGAYDFQFFGIRK